MAVSSTKSSGKRRKLAGVITQRRADIRRNPKNAVLDEPIKSKRLRKIAKWGYTVIEDE